MPAATVLIVDDEALVRWSPRERLEQEGHATLTESQAAPLLGINRDQVRYRIEKFGLHSGRGT